MRPYFTLLLAAVSLSAHAGPVVNPNGSVMTPNSELTRDQPVATDVSGLLSSESDPTVPAWAKQANPPQTMTTNAVDRIANAAVETNALTVATTNRVALLESSKADNAALYAHVANTNNPHAVTAAQVGAVPLVKDVDGNKTAVTIGSRVRGQPVGVYSLANGIATTASGESSHAEGGSTTASGYGSHAEGEGTTASGYGSHAEGSATIASGTFSHAEGENTHATGYRSRAEGVGTEASGYGSHASGKDTTASGDYSHADGVSSLANDTYSYTWSADEFRYDNPYTSHGEGTYNINPIGGTDGFYIGEQTLAQVIAAATSVKADKADISSTNPTFSNAVLAVGMNIDTNSVAVLNEIAATFGGFPLGAGETATTVGGLLAALAAAIAWLKKNKVQTLKLNDNSVETSADGGVAKLDDFFTGSNSLLTGAIDARLPYPLNAVPSTGLLKDRAINTTSLASVTVPDNFTDLLVRASVASSLSVTMPEAIATKYGDTFPGEAGEYLITITKTGTSEAYVRTIKLEVANA